MIVGLDVASTTGVAIYYGGDRIEAFSISGDAVYQLSQLLPLLTEDTTIIMEALIDFRFPAAIRKLAGIHGYLMYSFLKCEYPVYLAKPTNVRAFLGIKKESKKTAKLVLFDKLKQYVSEDSRKFTTDHSDAIAMILAYRGWSFDDELTIDVIDSYHQNDARRIATDLTLKRE